MPKPPPPTLSETGAFEVWRPGATVTRLQYRCSPGTRTFLGTPGGGIAGLGVLVSLPLGYLAAELAIKLNPASTAKSLFGVFFLGTLSIMIGGVILDVLLSDKGTPTEDNPDHRYASIPEGHPAREALRTLLTTRKSLTQLDSSLTDDITRYIDTTCWRIADLANTYQRIIDVPTATLASAQQIEHADALTNLTREFTAYTNEAKDLNTAVNTTITGPTTTATNSDPDDALTASINDVTALLATSRFTHADAIHAELLTTEREWQPTRLPSTT